MSRRVSHQDRFSRSGEVIIGIVISALTILAVTILKDYLATHFPHITFLGIDSTIWMLSIIVAIIAILAYVGVIKEKPSTK